MLLMCELGVADTFYWFDSKTPDTRESKNNPFKKIILELDGILIPAIGSFVSKIYTNKFGQTPKNKGYHILLSKEESIELYNFLKNTNIFSNIEIKDSPEFYKKVITDSLKNIKQEIENGSTLYYKEKLFNN